VARARQGLDADLPARRALGLEKADHRGRELGDQRRVALAVDEVGDATLERGADGPDPS
jgi:hypothetical protein